MTVMEENKEKKTDVEIIKLRGTGKIYLPENSFEFIPQKEGKPVQKNVKRYGAAKVHTTTGTDAKRVITLTCPESAADPRAEFLTQFKNVMKSEYNGDFPRELTPKGVVLKRADDIVMCVNKQKKRLEVSFQVGLEPEDKRDYKTKFYDKIQEISKCFAINETTIRKSK